MSTICKKKAITNGVISIIAIIIGYSTWYIISNNISITISHTVPFCFYQIPVGYRVTNAPEQITVELRGRKKQLRQIDMKNLSVHIDGQLLKPGTQKVVVAKEQLFLPDSIKLIHYTPSPITIQLEKIDPTNRTET